MTINDNNDKDDKDDKNDKVVEDYINKNKFVDLVIDNKSQVP